MDQQLRSLFNADFMPKKYAALVRCVNETEQWPADFRISETPVFLTRQFTNDVTRAANEIIAATRTPEAYVLDAGGKLVYHGRIDNSQKIEGITSNDLREALDEMLAGKAISKTGGAAFGCSIKRVS